METLSFAVPDIEPLDVMLPSNNYGGARQTSRYTSKRGRHRKSSIVKEIGAKHGRRLLSFSLIGFGVFVAGLAVQILLVQAFGVPKVTAYAVQLVLSVQVNFLANYRLTWGDRNAPFWRSCWRYNVKRAAGTLLNFGLYPLLIRLGMNYLAANTLLVIVLTPANYLLGDLWTFAAGTRKVGKTESSRFAGEARLHDGVPELQVDMSVY